MAIAFVHVIFPVLEIVPVNVGLLIGAFRSRAVAVAVDIGFSKSLVLSTLARLTIPLESPPVVPENIGL